MANPIALLAVAAAAGGAYWLYEKNKKVALPGQAPGQMPGIVSELTKGRAYTVLVNINKKITDDPRFAALGNIPNEEKIKQIISATFAQSGCKILSQPTIRDAENMKKAIAGEPSTWVFNMQWMMDDKYMPAIALIPWIDTAQFILMPTSQPV